VNDYFKVGYSYDSLTNNLNNYNNGSHEISLVFDLGVNGKYASKKRTPLFW
ncbi:type IX secretion system membrane protein PorP/SprF, partial [Lutibacter sp.]